MSENPTPPSTESRRALLTGIGGLAAGALIAARPAKAGPLDPPAGPVAPTHKTLTEVEPRTAINSTNTPGDSSSVFRITEPGSYYLTDNVTGVSGRYGIFIAADNVSIDLNGFTLAGVTGSLVGIQGYEGVRNTTIRNGVVTGWGSSGIYLGGGSSGTANGFLIEDVLASHNGAVGISAGFSGIYGVIARCVAHNNGTNGIEANSRALVESCTSTKNGSNGIVVSFNGVVRDCVVGLNGSSGIFAGAAVISGCSAYRNSQDGIIITYRCVVTGNTCTDNGTGNTGAGIHATSGSNRIEGNNCSVNVRGFDIDAGGNFIARNTCSANTTVNWDVASGNAILIVNAATSGAVFGNSGGTPPGSTDPNANFTH